MISVIIPTYNRCEVLAKVLPSYLSSSLVSQVIIVDDGSTDCTREKILAVARQDSRIQYVCHQKNLGMTFARNTGIQVAKENLILLSEDDLEMEESAIEILISHMKETNADIIAGRRIWMRIGETKEQALRRANAWSGPLFSPRLMEHFSHAAPSTDVACPLVNATMLVRKEVFDVIRFSNLYKGNAWREESDFQISALEAGFRIFFCPHAICYHYDRLIVGRGKNRLQADIRYLYWIFLNNIIFLQKHRTYLKSNIPDSLILGSPVFTSCLYLAYRSVLLIKTEIRRARLSRKFRVQWNQII